MVRATRSSKPVLAPGAKILVRDEEWIVRSVRPASQGRYAVHATGTSELVRGKNTIFLNDIDRIEELKPEETELVLDDTPRYRKSRLYLDSLLRRSPPTDNAIHAGHRAAMRPTPYQLQPAAKALRQLRPRILMADGVGLGKTLEVGVLLTELIQRGRGERILVLALKSILEQFQQELWARFTIPLVRLDSVGVQRVQSKIPTNMNPFYFYNRVIISIDTLKRDEKYRRYLEQCRWDAVVIDECQNVADRSKSSTARGSQRADLAKLLAPRTDALILTSATPHDGRASSFASLIELLEPTAIADKEDYTADEVDDFFIRRFKKDVADQIGSGFHDRVQDIEKQTATPEENALFDYLSTVKFQTIGKTRGGSGMLFRTLLLKAFLSSPSAFLSTVAERLKKKKVQDQDSEEAAHDREVLTELLDLGERIKPAAFSKYQAFLQRLKGFGLDEKKTSERVVVFSERVATLEFLATRLKKDLGLTDDQIAVFHGSLDDQRQQALVREFGSEKSAVRILLASDAASEGINLHYYCHRLIHFDLPWSLITMEQRNGRIDRYGQEFPPEIYYMLTVPGNEELAGDLRVLERLIEKEDAAQKNLGDVAWLLNLHDKEKEEEHIAAGVEGSKTAEEVLPDEPQSNDFMELLFGSQEDKEPDATCADPNRLFENDREYAREAFDQLLDDDETVVTWMDNVEGFEIYPPEDLKQRYKFLPPELYKKGKAIRLTTDRDLVMQSHDKAREDDVRWPEWELFWEQHPVAEWLTDRVLGEFGRHAAPIMEIPQGLDGADCLFLCQGLISNNRSQPVLIHWFGVPISNGEPGDIISLNDVIQQTGISGAPSNPNSGTQQLTIELLNSYRTAVVEAAGKHMLNERRARAESISEPLREGVRKLATWKKASLASFTNRQTQLLPDSSSKQALLEKRIEREEKRINDIYKARYEWINDGLRTSDQPFLRIAAVFIPGGQG